MKDLDVKLEETVDTIASSLLERAKSRDEEAWRRLVYIYSPLVYQWCRKAGLEPNTSADVGQEVFVAVARNVGEFRRDTPGDSFRGWLCRITQNKLNDHWRALNRNPAIVGDGLAEDLAASIGDSDSDSAVMDNETDTRLLFQRVVDFVRGQFSDEDWRAFWRVTVDQVPAAQVADELGCTRNKVYVAKSRIMGSIRREFENDLKSG